MTRDTRRRLLYAAAFTMVLALLAVKFFIVDVWTIPQNGMYPTLPAGSRFLCLRRPYADASRVRRGDIVVFTQPYQGKPYDFIWRVVGLPGDRVECRGQTVSVNGQPLARQPVRADAAGRIVRETNGGASYEIALQTAPARPPPAVSVIVPAGQFFVLGDNRDEAMDSRYLGPGPFATIKAKKW